MDIRTAWNIVDRYFQFPSFYIVHDTEAQRLAGLILECNFNIGRVLRSIQLDCAAMCSGCIFCAPEEIMGISACQCRPPRAD
jgi:hypothetical protein